MTDRTGPNRRSPHCARDQSFAQSDLGAGVGPEMHRRGIRSPLLSVESAGVSIGRRIGNAASRGIAVCAIGMAVASCTSAGEKSHTALDPSIRCQELIGVTIPSTAFALPTGDAKITDAALRLEDEKTGLPEFCRVRAAIAAKDSGDPSILFQINLPSQWNLKTVQFGGGGSNGTIVQAIGSLTGGGGAVKSPLAQGYVTYGSDSGHQGQGIEFYANPQAFANYAYEAIKRSKDLTSAITLRYYGVSARRNYHAGGSKGGQEALQAAQRYYADFDGVISNFPAAQSASMELGWNRMAYFAYGVPGGALNTAEQELLKSTVLSSCDALDGAADGIVSNTAACNQTFDVAVLRCPGGADTGDACFSDPQIAALKAAGSSFQFAFPMPNGVTSVGPFPVFLGSDLKLWLGNGSPGSQHPFFSATGARPEALKSTGISREVWRSDIEKTAAIYDASNPDLDGFEKRNGKLLLLQGTNDILVPEPMTTNFFNALQARYKGNLSRFARYYIVPGWGHGSGDFHLQWDSLSTLDAWVETGKAPQNLVGADGAASTRGRTRPICEYPKWPKHVGPDLNDAASFVCATN